MIFKRLLLIATLILVLFCFGCTKTIIPNESIHQDMVKKHVVASSSFKEPVEAYVLIPSSEENRYVSESASSFTGGAWTIEMPIGKIESECTVHYLEQMNHGKYKVTIINSLPAARDNLFIVEPKITSFHYWWNALKNIGFAITPQVELDADITVYEGGKKPKIYNMKSDRVDGDTYVMAAAVFTRVYDTTIKAMAKILDDWGRQVGNVIDNTAMDNTFVTNSGMDNNNLILRR